MSPNPKLILHQCVSLFLVHPIKPEHTFSSTLEALQPVLHKFSDVFEPPNGLPPVCPIAHTIDLISGAMLPNAPAYRLAPQEATEIEKQLTQLLESGHIQPNSSPCASPTFIVPKKYSSKWHMVTDYRALNKATVKNQYPLPCIDDLLDHLHSAKYFTKMDLTSGYHQVQMHTSDICKIAFKMKFGLYEWLVMPFSVTNTPAIFM